MVALLRLMDERKSMSINVNREALLQRVKQLPPNIAVIEASWDGDSSGWYVMVSAIEKLRDGNYKRHYITAIGHGQGEYHDFYRALHGEVPPYPEGLLAKEVGQELADSLHIPFYFASPDKPALDEVPDWVDWIEGRTSSIPIRLIDIQSVIKRFSASDVKIVEGYWAYHHTWYPKLAVVTAKRTTDNAVDYEAHNIGELYWDDHDQGRVIRGMHIPLMTPIAEALRLGKKLAEALNTTFYFASPDSPAWKIPRWVDIQKSNGDEPRING